MFLRFRGGGIGHKLLNLSEKDAGWEDFDEDMEVDDAIGAGTNDAGHRIPEEMDQDSQEDSDQENDFDHDYEDDEDDEEPEQNYGEDDLGAEDGDAPGDERMYENDYDEL